MRAGCRGTDPGLTRRDLLRLGGVCAAGGAAALGGLALPARMLGAGATQRALRSPGSTPFPSAPGQPRPDLAPELANIDHIIVVMMENHSFDNYFGMLPWHVPALRGRVDGFPAVGADGVPTVTQTDPTGAVYRAFPLPTPCQNTSRGPSQSWNASHHAYDGGRMDGFLVGSGEIAMGYWDEHTLPFYSSLASQFPVCDRYFCSTLCQTYPNRVFLMAATAAGLVSTDTPPPTVTPRNGHIFDVLDHYGISWASYFSDLPTPGLFGAAWAATKLGTHLIGPFADVDATVAGFSAACNAGTLQQVVFVETEYQYASEENPQDITAGQHFVAGVVNALMASPAWARSLLVFTYDEHGGYYDHVVPPATLNPGDGSHPNLPQSQWFGDDYTQLGFRVPTVIVSPWSRRDFTSHTLYDHTSILATIQRKWNLPALTLRDANANHLGDCLVSSGAAPFAHPPSLAAAQPTTQATSLVCTQTANGAGVFPARVNAGPAAGGGSPGGTAGKVAAAGGTPNTGMATPSAWGELAAALGLGALAIHRKRSVSRMCRPASHREQTAGGPDRGSDVAQELRQP